MSLKTTIDQDLKQAMLAGDKKLVSVIRGIKSAILNEEISTGNRNEGLADGGVVSLLQKESKKRSDAIELYVKASQPERADNERYEQQVIDGYLPEKLEDDVVRQIISSEIEALSEPFTRQQMGIVIGSVKAKTAGSVGGATIARLVQEKL